MDCSAPPATEAPVASLVETVLALEGGWDVVVGVVGSGADRLRAAVPAESPVYTLRVPDDTQLVDAAAHVFPIPGRCVIVAREEGSGWSFVVSAGADPAPPPAGRAAGPAAARKEPPVHPSFGAQVVAGAAGGAYTCTAEFGGGDYTTWRASPFASASGEVGLAPVYLFMGLHGYPLYFYGGGVCHVMLIPLYMVDGGLWVGTRTVRVGAYASIGILAVEGGVRVAVTPWVAGGTRLHGVELRAAWLGDRAYLGAVGYTMVWR